MELRFKKAKKKKKKGKGEKEDRKSFCLATFFLLELFV